LNGSKQAFHKILGTVFTKEKQIIIDVFKEILSKRGEILYQFINDKAFECILSRLDVDERIIYKNIFNGNKVFESIYVLKQLKKPISEQNAIALFQHVTEILFLSKHEIELKHNITSYLNVLSLLQNQVPVQVPVVTTRTLNIIILLLFVFPLSILFIFNI